MIRVIITALYFLMSVMAFGNETAAEKNISGTILDAETGEPLEFATISVYDNGVLVDGIITDEQGKFSIAAKKGNYLLKVEYISYKPYETQIELKKHLDIGVITLEINMEALGEVEVIAEKSTLELKLDKKVFNVGKDLLSQNGSLSQVLDNVPSVAVDLEGNVSLRGNPNVTVLINGKPSVLTANNGLDQIPAENIDQIEVITNPSARYQASGTAGIINVVLKKNKKQGLNGAVNLSNGIPADFDISANLNYKTDKINLFSTLGYRFVDLRMEQRVNQSSIEDGTLRFLDQFADTYRNARVANMYLGMDYFINEENTFTASYYKVLIDRNNRVAYNYDYSDALHNLDSTIVSYEKYHEPMDHNQLELSYVKTYGADGKKLTLDLQYDFWNDDENENLSTAMLAPVPSEPQLSRTKDIESSRDFLVQADYINPINENSTFETGLRGETRVITSDYKVEEYDGSQWQIFEGIDNAVDYQEKIGAVYAQFAGKANKLSYQLGLRAEYTNIEISDDNKEFNNSKSYTKLFPTAHLTFNFSESSNAQLSYSRRINRPGFWFLNPFGGLAQLNTRRQGNPDLDPTLTHSFEFGFLTTVGKLRINPSVYFQNAEQVFQFYTSPNDEGVLITKPINLDHENRLGLEISATYNPAKWLRLSGEINYFTFKREGSFNGQDLGFSDYSWFSRVNSRVKLPSETTLQASFNYRGKRKNAMETTEPTHWMNLGISKNLIPNLALTFNVRNVFNSRAENLLRTGADFTYRRQLKRLGPRYKLTLTYKFNQKKGDRQRRPGDSNRG